MDFKGTGLGHSVQADLLLAWRKNLHPVKRAVRETGSVGWVWLATPCSVVMVSGGALDADTTC